MALKIINKNNYAKEMPESVRKETPKGESMTVPGQAMPMKVLMDRFTTGQGVPVNIPDIIPDEFGDIDVTTMDRIEREQLAKDIKATIELKEKQLGDVQRAKRDQKQAKANANKPTGQQRPGQTPEGGEVVDTDNKDS